MKPIFCHLSVADDYNLGAQGYPSISEWMRAVASLRVQVDKGFLLNFGGPDALAKEGFFDLVAFSKQKGFKISATVNPYLIDEAMAKKINDSGIECMNIVFNLPEKDERGNFRSMEDLYHKVVDGVSYLNRFSDTLLHKGISCVINAINLDYISELENWVFRCNRIDWIQFLVLGPSGNNFLDNKWYKTAEYSAVWPGDTKKVHAVLDELIRLKKLGYKINNPISQLEDFKSYYENPAEFVNKTQCKSENVIHVNPIGDIFLCHCFDSIGNIKTTDLSTTWGAEQALKIRSKMVECKKNCHYLLNNCSEDETEDPIVKTKKIRSALAARAMLKPIELDSSIIIPKPGFCCLGITNKCILKCKMCYKWQNDVAEEEPPTVEHYKKFIADFKDLVGEDFIINFGGGEALLCGNVLELVRICRDKGFLTNIASNGWLIDETMAKMIDASGLNEINFSLDSLNEDTHDYLRGVKGVYSRVMNAIEQVSKYCKNTKIGLCSVIYDRNLNELPALLEWADKNKKINSIFFLAPMQPNSTGVEKEWWKGQYDYLWPKDTDKAIAFVDKLLKMGKTGYKMGNNIAQLEAFKLYFQSPGSFVKKTKCNLDRAVHVSAIGDVFFCYRKSILGNIKDGDDIRDIWRSYMAQDVRQDIANCKDNCHYLINCFFEGDYPFGLNPESK